MIRAVRLGFMCSVFAAGCSQSTPTEPATPTRIIRVGGNMNFGEVQFFTVREDGVITVSNDGTENLQIKGLELTLNVPNSSTNPNLRAGCLSMLRPLSTTAFAVGPGQTLSIGWRFSPVINPSRGWVPAPPDDKFDCSGTLTVEGDQTSGTNTIAVTAVGG